MVSLVLLANPAWGQSARTSVEHQQAVTANPFLSVAGWFNAEYERKIGPTTTWGLSGSLAEYEDFQYRSAKFLFRYYPQEAALSRLFVGGRTGVYSLHDQEGDGLRGTEDSKSFFAVGVELGYTWLLGSERHFAVSIGGGMSRLFGGDLEDAQLMIPTVRLVNIGVAF